MGRLLAAACLFLLLAGCSEKAKDLYETAQFEERHGARGVAGGARGAGVAARLLGQSGSAVDAGPNPRCNASKPGCW